MAKVSRLSRRLFTEEEVRFLAQRFRQVMGGPISGLLAQYGISLEDHYRFQPLAVRLEGRRIDRGLSRKEVGAALRVAQYRIAEIENARTRTLDSEVLVRYVEYLGLKNWFGRWKNSNAELALRLRITGAGNLTVDSKMTRRKRGVR